MLTPFQAYAIVTYPFAAIWYGVDRCRNKDSKSHGFWRYSIGYFRVTMFPRMFDIMHSIPGEKPTSQKRAFIEDAWPNWPLFSIHKLLFICLYISKNRQCPQTIWLNSQRVKRIKYWFIFQKKIYNQNFASVYKLVKVLRSTVLTEFSGESSETWFFRERSFRPTIKV